MNITWYFNSTPEQFNASVTSANYTRTAQAGVHNITAVAANTNGSTSKTWAWNVTQDILSYYRGLSNNPNIVETTDLLKAADDWNRNITVSGFTAPITTQELLALADEWAKA